MCTRCALAVHSLVVTEVQPGSTRTHYSYSLVVHHTTLIGRARVINWQRHADHLTATATNNHTPLIITCASPLTQCASRSLSVPARSLSVPSLGARPPRPLSRSMFSMPSKWQHVHTPPKWQHPAPAPEPPPTPPTSGSAAPGVPPQAG